jgi:hypothetical protein
VSVSVGFLQGFQLERVFGLVGTSSLNWQPQVDELISLYSHERLRSVDHGEAIWTNLGPRHIVSVRARERIEGLAAASALHAAEQESLAELANSLEARLMPCGMHPWMRAAQAEAWPHGQAPRDEAMISTFGAERHGLNNQQKLRLSIPFASDFEFARLFGALRFVMPLMPALCASSPFAEGKRGPALACRVASRRDLLSGQIDFADSLVPRPASCRDEYQSDVLTPLEKTLKARGLSQALNAKEVCAHGIIADFQAGLVHVEMLDMQECLQADIAVCAGIGAVTLLVQTEEFAALGELNTWPQARLGELLELSVVDGEEAVFRDVDYAKALGFPERGSCRVAELWQHLMEERLSSSPLAEESMPALERIASEGPLARRLLRALDPGFDDEELYNLYKRVLDCLEKDTLL